jgi:hypothetical protein
MKLRFLLWGTLAIAISATPATATMTHGYNVPAMIEASDLIVVGRVSGNRVEPGAINDTQVFYISVDRTLKGTAAGHGRFLKVRLDVSDQVHNTVSARQYGVFFLRRSAGSYIPADAKRPVLVASDDGGPAASTPRDTYASVAAELARVLTTPAAALTDRVTGVHTHATTDANDQAQAIYAEAAEALAAIPYQRSKVALTQAARSTLLSARLWALVSLSFGDGAHEADGLKAQVRQSITPSMLENGSDMSLAMAMLPDAMQRPLRPGASISASSLP